MKFTSKLALSYAINGFGPFPDTPANLAEGTWGRHVS